MTGAGPGYLLPAVPFAAALTGLLISLRPDPLSPARRRVAAGLGIGGAAVALAAAVALLVAGAPTVDASTTWIDLGGLLVSFGVRLDGPAALVAVAVGAVALAVQVYSTAYLADDDRYPAYAAQVSLFTAAMLLVVVAGDLIMLLVGWEVMGACSYLLIAHDRRLPEAPAAAVKAFLVTRVGDVGFLLGIAVLGIGAGSFRIADVLAHDYPPATVTTAALLLLAGVAGKSAQFPLHTWLPDAMAGPTPISALIHAATMVAAGVYVVIRLYPIFLAAPTALIVLGVLGVITLLLGALAATAADDIKRVLAWSTVSQLGYMTGALAVGSPPAALFHLLTHAAFKALLFLVAGCVIHAVGSNLMSVMGGLRRPMPVTFAAAVVGLGALAGLPPLAGFWSKESVLYAASAAARHPGDGPAPSWLGWLVWLAGLAGVAITAWYATRLLLRTFFGPSRLPAGAHPHDPPAAMRWPVLALAVPAALLGFVGLVPTVADWLTAGPAGESAVDGQSAVDLVHLGPDLLLPILLLAVGAGAAVWLYRRDPAADPARALGPARPAFAAGFWLDTVQHAVVVRPVVALARAVRVGDESGVDGAVTGTGRGVTGLGAAVGRWHAAPLPRAVTLVLVGVLLLGSATAIIGVLS
ncbi:NADH-quinone oxidoreductase subunit L [Solwaraspora sp. WMMD406]|uniref:NADH-quinone oxidoreductase subunit 5 family protein n=1 Tax=Solwaraspora sp. WMMD406 TaxID=3016095 RepID=UPI002417714F|nr:NADH-quinone oxidoreductase subunit L [Solwaraspora sp. WMMD406]MDG4763636.1 NADH-quinone oxidoreductase subunit L [Solwaraspora sp. WMMD406]